MLIERTKGYDDSEWTQSCISNPSPVKETILKNTNHEVSIMSGHHIVLKIAWTLQQWTLKVFLSSPLLIANHLIFPTPSLPFPLTFWCFPQTAAYIISMQVHNVGKIPRMLAQPLRTLHIYHWPCWLGHCSLCLWGNHRLLLGLSMCL